MAIPPGTNDTAVVPEVVEDIRHRGIPDPQNTVESLQASVAALKEVVETLLGDRGDD